MKKGRLFPLSAAYREPKVGILRLGNFYTGTKNQSEYSGCSERFCPSMMDDEPPHTLTLTHTHTHNPSIHFFSSLSSQLFIFIAVILDAENLNF